MALKSPSRLPRHLSRTANAYSRSFAQKRYSRASRRTGRNVEWMKRGLRRWSGTGKALWKELKLWLWFMAIACVVGLLAVLLFSPVFNVKQIHIRRQDARIDLEEVQQTLLPLFKERLFFVKTGEIESMLKAAYPDITQVSINKDYPSTLSVSVFVDPLVAQLNIQNDDSAAAGTGAVVLTDTGSYSYVTAQGFAIVSPVKLNKTPLPQFIVRDWGMQPVNRVRILPPALLKAVFQARDTLRDSFGLPVTQTVIYLRAREFHLQTKKAALWFDLGSPLPVQFARFREFLKALPLDTAKEYIDLRVSDRVMYK